MVWLHARSVDMTRELRPFYDRVDHLLDIHSMGRYAHSLACIRLYLGSLHTLNRLLFKESIFNYFGNANKLRSHDGWCCAIAATSTATTNRLHSVTVTSSSASSVQQCVKATKPATSFTDRHLLGTCDRWVFLNMLDAVRSLLYWACDRIPLCVEE